MIFLRHGAALLAVLSLACSGTPTPPTDAGTDTTVVTDTPTVDGTTDGAPKDQGGPEVPREPSPIYGSCRNNDECLEGLRCLSPSEEGLPGGECTRPCTMDSECFRPSIDGRRALDGYCGMDAQLRMRRCYRICQNGMDCEREGYTCLTLNRGTFQEVSLCIGVCTDATCTDGTVCDHDTGRCRPMGSPPPPGRALGESCVPNNRAGATPDQLCRSGLCNPESQTSAAGVTTYTGFNGGQCTGRCILPPGFNPGSFWPEAEFPRSNCPTGGICLPSASSARGDLGTCLDECRTDSDCRTASGYFCRRQITLSSGMTRTWMNGFCTPLDCAVAGRMCPMGLMCNVVTSATGARRGTCIPMMMRPEM